MTRSLFYILLILSIAACKNKQPSNEGVQFELHYLDIQLEADYLSALHLHRNLIIGALGDNGIFVLDTAYRHVTVAEKALNNTRAGLRQMYFYKDDIVLLLRNDEIVVFDSNFIRKPDVEGRLTKLKVAGPFQFHDSFFLLNEQKMWLVYDDYSLVPVTGDKESEIRKKLHLYWGAAPAYEDSMWHAYTCSNGEWGSNLFFENRKSGKLYSYPISDFFDLVKYKDGYHLIEGSIYGGVGFTRIADPGSLPSYKLNVDGGFCCNCDSIHNLYYRMADSLRQKWHKEWSVNTYFGNRNLYHLQTFHLDNRLYSLCAIDTLFLVIRHDKDSVQLVQTFAKKQRHKWGGYIHRAGNGEKTISGFADYWSQGTKKENVMLGYRTLGLYIVDSNKIYVYETHSKRYTRTSVSN